MFFSGTFSANLTTLSYMGDARRQWLASTLWASKICTPCSILLKEFPKCWRALSDNLRDRGCQGPNEKLVFQFCVWNKKIGSMFKSSSLHFILSIDHQQLCLCMQLNFNFTMSVQGLFINIFSHKCETPQLRCNEKPTLCWYVCIHVCGCDFKLLAKLVAELLQSIEETCRRCNNTNV